MRLHAFTSALVACALGMSPGAARAIPAPTKVTAKYLYRLSDNTGVLATSWASLVYNAQYKELYVIDRQDGSVGIFNEAGMEIYRFGDDADVGTIVSLDVMDGGDLLALALEKGKPVIQRCNFRGEPKGRIELRNVPPTFADGFSPETIFYRGGKIYLAQKGTMKLVVADEAGNCLETHDYFHELGIDATKDGRGGAPGMRALNVTGDGAILFTVAPLFKVFVIAPDGRASSFGQKGGSPGKFNITGGVAQDEHGNIFVSDVLKCAILVFDRNFEFVGQFGDRGWEGDGLVTPFELAIGGGKLFVSQGATRGVSIFEISSPDQAPQQAVAP